MVDYTRPPPTRLTFTPLDALRYLKDTNVWIRSEELSPLIELVVRTHHLLKARGAHSPFALQSAVIDMMSEATLEFQLVPFGRSSGCCTERDISGSRQAAHRSRLHI